MPRLKQRPAEQLEYLFGLVERLTALGAERRLFDYVLLRMLRAYLTDLPEGGLGQPSGKAPAPRDALRTLLAACAWHGHESADAARQAYRAGLAGAGITQAQDLAPMPDAAPDFAGLDAALLRLKRLRPSGKRAVLRAVLATIRHDRRIDVDELELFRAVAATLGCPVPPLPSAAAVGETP